MNVCPHCSNILNNIGNSTDHSANVNRVLNPMRSNSTSQPWFHGKIDREDVEKLLVPKTDGLFLVRESTSFPGDYTLCVCHQDSIEYYLIKSHQGQLTIDEEELFDNLEELVKHYKRDADGLCTKLVKHVCAYDDMCIIPNDDL